MTPLEQKKQNRYLFLELLYKDSNGNTGAMFNMWEVGEELKINRNETQLIVDYLTGENLIEPRALGGGIVLTHWGVKEVEEALQNPDKPTEHFLPINIINIGSMHNSTLQQATANSTINFHFDSKKIADLDGVISSIKKIQDTLYISIDLHKELVSEIQTLEIQSQSPRPKNIIITESLKTIKTLLESVGGNALTPIIIGQIAQLLT